MTRRPFDSQSFAAWIAVSLALHAAALLVFPQISKPDTSRVEVLEVVLERVEPPRVLAQAPAPTVARAAPPRPEKREKTVTAPPKPEPPKETPVLAAPAQPRVAESAPFSVSEATAEPRPAAESAAGPREAARSGPPARADAGASDKTTPPVYDASYLRNPKPPYPNIARRRGEQGTVTLRVLVTREGAPASVSVHTTSGSTSLDNAAIETVKTWRFAPARQGSQPIEATVLVPVVFRLEGSS